ncbi:helix-turn-helix domain-containing protein [Paenibacillus sp. strain BS8-2]
MPSMRAAHPFYTLSSIRYLTRSACSGLTESRLPVPALLYVTKGSGRIHVGDRNWSVTTDQLLHIPAGVAFHVEIDNEVVEYYQLLVRAAMVSFGPAGYQAVAIRSIAEFPEEIPVILDGGQIWRNRLSVLLSAYTLSNGRADDWDMELIQLVKELCNTCIPAEQPQEADGISQTMIYMEQHYDSKITRDALARIAMLTPGAYCRSFKKTTGVTPTDYLQQVRIEKAKQHLALGLSLKEAAAAVSYKNEFHFSRVFKKVTGIPPTLYIKREMIRVAIATRFNWRDNFESIGFKPILGIDCYRHPGMDEFEYERRVLLRLSELREAKPDLIIADYSHEPFHETFKKIAPTIIIPHSFDWRDTQMQLAELVGREQEAAYSIQLSEQIAAETAVRLRKLAAGQNIAMLQVMSDHIILQGTVRHPLNELLHRELQLQADPAVPRDLLRLQATAQDIPELKADHLWIRLYNEHVDVQRVYNNLQARDFWPIIPAVVNNQVRHVSNWLLMSWTPQGRQAIMSEIEQYFARAL